MTKTISSTSRAFAPDLRFIWQGLILAGALLMGPLAVSAQDDTFGVRLEAHRGPDANGRHTLAEHAIEAIQIRLLHGSYAVVTASGTKRVAKVGDRLGREGFLLTAIHDGRLLFRTPGGFALLETTADGDTFFREMLPGEVPADVRRVIEQARSRAQTSDRH